MHWWEDEGVVLCRWSYIDLIPNCCKSVRKSQIIIGMIARSKGHTTHNPQSRCSDNPQVKRLRVIGPIDWFSSLVSVYIVS